MSNEQRKPKFMMCQVVCPIICESTKIRGQILEIMTTETMDSYRIGYAVRMYQKNENITSRPIHMWEEELIDIFDDKFKNEEKG